MRLRHTASVQPWYDGELRALLAPECFAAKLGTRTRQVPPSIALILRAAGLKPAEPRPLFNQLLRAALSWIARVPDLASVVEATVSEIHFLKAEVGYDISHSEPQLLSRSMRPSSRKRDKPAQRVSA
jgi:hypothetical protein